MEKGRARRIIRGLTSLMFLSLVVFIASSIALGIFFMIESFEVRRVYSEIESSMRLLQSAEIPSEDDLEGLEKSKEEAERVERKIFWGFVALLTITLPSMILFLVTYRALARIARRLKELEREVKFGKTRWMK